MCLLINVLQVSYLTLHNQIYLIPFCYSYPHPTITKSYHVSPSLAHFLPHEKTTPPRRSGAGGVDLRRYRMHLLPGTQRVRAGETNKKGGQRSGGAAPGARAQARTDGRPKRAAQPLAWAD